MKTHKEYDITVTQERIRESLDLSGITQKELAKATGISAGTLRQYLTGANNMPARKLFSVASELDLSADYLLGLTDKNQI